MALFVAHSATGRCGGMVWNDYGNVCYAITLWRGGREAYGAALEKRFPIASGRGFKSHPLRNGAAMWR